jgi:rhodanese-related sulfurtransferase
MAEVDVETLATQLQHGAFLLDVRRLEEYVEAHVVGAVLVPLDQLANRVAEIPTDRDVYVICRSGARSANAARFLASVGITATNVAGGTLAWLDAGRPVATGSSPA